MFAEFHAAFDVIELATALLLYTTYTLEVDALHAVAEGNLTVSCPRERFKSIQPGAGAP